MYSRFINIAVAAIMVLGGISQFFPASMSSIVVGIYVIIFGLGGCILLKRLVMVYDGY